MMIWERFSRTPYNLHGALAFLRQGVRGERGRIQTQTEGRGSFRCRAIYEDAGLHIPSEMPTRQDLESSIVRRRSHGNQNL